MYRTKDSATFMWFRFESSSKSLGTAGVF